MTLSPKQYLSYAASRFRGRSMRSSLSDNQVYPDLCARAASNDDSFRTFRRAPEYQEILEHVTERLGARYLAAIKRDPALLLVAQELCGTDSTGSPIQYNYPSLGLASPTTLRYLKVAQDLGHCFGSLDGMNVVEVGVGYGGQCRVLCHMHQVASYTLVDLAPVLQLTKRFLRTTSPAAPVNYKASSESSQLASDLLISNYAFSELRRDVQEQYMSSLIGGASRGYVTFNRINPVGFESMSVREFAKRVNGTVLFERPMSYPGNRVIVWGHDRNSV